MQKDFLSCKKGKIDKVDYIKKKGSYEHSEEPSHKLGNNICSALNLQSTYIKSM